MNKEKSFTLIELLVVIAVIGLLATVVLVSMGGFQSKARISKVLEFTQSVNHVLGAYAVGIWSFDENAFDTCSGGEDVCDASGYGNDGIISGATFSSDTPYAEAGRGSGKYSLNFNGNGSVDAGNGSSLSMGGGEITFALWAKPATGASYPLISGRGRLFLGLDSANNRDIRVDINDGSSWCGIFSFDDAGVAVNAWNHIAVTFSKSSGSQGRGYLNGMLLGTRTAPCNPGAGGGNFQIGAQGGWNNFNGLIDEVQVYQNVLTLGQIQKLYAEALPGHRDLAIQ